MLFKNFIFRFHIKKLICVFILIFFVGVSSGTSFGIPQEEAELLLYRGYNEFLNSNYKRALSLFDAALSLDTYLIDVYFLKSLVYLRLGRLSDALKEINYYLEVKPRDKDAIRLKHKIVNYISLLKDLLSKNYSFPQALIETVFDPYKLFLGTGFTSFWAGLTARIYNASCVTKDPFKQNRFFISDFSGGKVVAIEYRAFKAIGKGYLKNPTALAFDGSGNLYVCDWGNGKIVVFSRERDWTLSSKPSKVIKPPGLIAPRGITFAYDGSFFVVDWGQPAILHFDREGNLLNKWGPYIGNILLQEPVSLAFKDDMLFVADYATSKVYKFNLRSNKVLNTWDIPKPLSVKFDSLGRMYVLSEAGFVVVYEVDGSLIKKFEAPVAEPVDFVIRKDESLIVVSGYGNDWVRIHWIEPVSKYSFMVMYSAMEQKGSVVIKFTATAGYKPLKIVAWSGVDLIYGGVVASAISDLRRIVSRKKVALVVDPLLRVPKGDARSGILFVGGKNWVKHIDVYLTSVISPLNYSCIVVKNPQLLDYKDVFRLLAISRINAIPIHVILPKKGKVSQLIRRMVTYSGGSFWYDSTPIPLIKEKGIPPRYVWRLSAPAPLTAKPNPLGLGYKIVVLLARYEGADFNDRLPVLPLIKKVEF